MNMQKPNLCRTKEEISQLLIEGVEELIGQDDLQKLLKQEGVLFGFDLHQHTQLEQSLTYGDIKKLDLGLKEIFGEDGSRGAVLRAGRCFFQNLFQKYGIDSGLNSLEYRMQPLKKRILIGLETISALLSDSIQMEIKVTDDESKWYWACENGDGMPVSDFSIGLLQAYLSWASGGKTYPIQKFYGMSSGCVIEIGKKAIG